MHADLSGQKIKVAAPSRQLHDALQSEDGTRLVDFTVGIKETCLQETVTVGDIPPVLWYGGVVHLTPLHGEHYTF